MENGNRRETRRIEERKNEVKEKINLKFYNLL